MKKRIEEPMTVNRAWTIIDSALDSVAADRKTIRVLEEAISFLEDSVLKEHLNQEQQDASTD